MDLPRRHGGLSKRTITRILWLRHSRSVNLRVLRGREKKSGTVTLLPDNSTPIGTVFREIGNCPHFFSGLLDQRNRAAFTVRLGPKARATQGRGADGIDGGARQRRTGRVFLPVSPYARRASRRTANWSSSCSDPITNSFGCCTTALTKCSLFERR